MTARNRLNADYATGYFAGLRRDKQAARPSAAYMAGYRRGQTERYQRAIAAVKGSRDIPAGTRWRRQGDGRFDYGKRAVDLNRRVDPDPDLSA